MARMTRPGEPTAPEAVREYVAWGAGPRASQYLVLGAKARAAMDGRPMADLEDLEAVTPPVLRHRLVLNFNAEAAGKKADAVVREVAATARG
jgi:MoxR-like ATPase